MSKPLIVENTITINASADIVWDVLVNPAQTKKYMFGCETVSDWKPGSSLIWKMQHEGKDFIPVKGSIVKIEPGKELVYTVIDPQGKYPDIPENYLTVTYRLKEENGSTFLTVTQGDYSTVAEGEKRYNDTVQEGGWSSVLDKIKEVAEAG